MIIKPSIYKLEPFKILSAAEKSVLLNLMIRANQESCECFPSISQICEDTGLSRASVCRAKNTLGKAGWIFRVSKGKAAGQANKYRVQASPLVSQGDQLTKATSLPGILVEEETSLPGRPVTSLKYAPLTDNVLTDNEGITNNENPENKEDVPSQGVSPQRASANEDHENSVNKILTSRETLYNAKIQEMARTMNNNDFFNSIGNVTGREIVKKHEFQITPDQDDPQVDYSNLFFPKNTLEEENDDQEEEDDQDEELDF
jgi:hypothetical protein